MALACLIDPRSIFHGILAVQDHMSSQHNPSIGLGHHRIHHRRTNVLSRQRRGPEHCRWLCYQCSLHWLDRHLRHCDSPHVRKVRSIARPPTKRKESKAHGGTGTPGYRKYSPSSSSLAPPATTSTPPCHPSVPLVQSPPTAAPSSPSNSPPSSDFPPSAPTSTSTTPPGQAAASRS